MKKNVAKTLLGLAFLLVFNVIYYIIGGVDRTASCWIAYAFIHVSYLLLVFSGALTGREGRTPELELPVWTISFIYFAANLVIGSAIIIVSPKGIKFCIIMEVIMLAVYLVFLCTTLLANEHTMQQSEQGRIEKRYVQECSANVKELMGRTTDRETYKKLERVYDVIHASPLQSNDGVMEYEIEVIRLLRVLDKNLRDKDAQAMDETVQKILQNAEARNRKLKAAH
jgi:hypothetical protein